MFVGGFFTSYNGSPAPYFVKLNNNGSIDTSFNVGTGFNNVVNKIKIQTDGKVLVGGNFVTYNGVTVNRMVRLNTNGSIDTSFNIGAGFNNSVTDFVTQSDNKVVVVGNFTSYNSNTGINRIVKLNADGSFDESFNMDTGFNVVVNVVQVQPDNKILVAGNFTTYRNISAVRIIRLNEDGSTDSSFNSGTGVASVVNSMILLDNGKILVGGAFTMYNGISVSKIVRLNSNGTIDNTFTQGYGFGGSTINSINVDEDGKLIMGGNFNSYYNYYSFNHIIRLEENGLMEDVMNP